VEVCTYSCKSKKSGVQKRKGRCSPNPAKAREVVFRRGKGRPAAFKNYDRCMHLVPDTCQYKYNVRKAYSDLNAKV